MILGEKRDWGFIAEKVQNILEENIMNHYITWKCTNLASSL